MERRCIACLADDGPHQRSGEALTAEDSFFRHCPSRRGWVEAKPGRVSRFESGPGPLTCIIHEGALFARCKHVRAPSFVGGTNSGRLLWREEL